MPKSKSLPNPRVQLTRSPEAERAWIQLKLKMSTLRKRKPPSSAQLCFICGENNIATHGQSKTLFKKQAALFKTFILAPDFLPTLNLQPHFVAEMKNKKNLSVCAPCLTFIEEVWDYHQQIEALKQNIKNVMEKTRASLLLRKCSGSELLQFKKTSPPPSPPPPPVAMFPMPDFEMDNCIEYQNYDNDEFDRAINDALEASMALEGIEEQEERKETKKTKTQWKVKAMQFVDNSASQESPEEEVQIKVEPESDGDDHSVDFQPHSENDSHSDPEYKDVKIASSTKRKRKPKKASTQVSSSTIRKRKPKKSTTQVSSSRIKRKYVHLPKNSATPECPSCHKVLSSHKILLVHKVTVCGLEVPQKELDDYHIKFHYCEYCGKMFGKLCDLQKHLRNHITNKSFPCGKCDKSFSHQHTLIAHKAGDCKGNENFDDVKCPKCNKILSTHRHLLIHKVIVCGFSLDEEELKKYHIKILPCPHCPKQFARGDDLKKHLRVHAGIRLYACSRCGKTFVQKSTCTEHEKITCTSTPEEVKYKEKVLERTKLKRKRLKESKRFICGCKMRFHTAQELAEHHAGTECTLGGDNVSVSCNVCGVSVKRYGLELHHRLVHMEKRTVLCPHECGWAFFRQKLLFKHMQKNHGAPKVLKNFWCPKCKGRFTTKVELEEHKNADTCEKVEVEMVVCHLCGKSLSASSLSSHVRRHTTPPSFKCTVGQCQRQFHSRANFNRHLNHHKNEEGRTTFTCWTCFVKFTRKEDKEQHQCVMCTYPGCPKGYRSEKLLARHVRIVHEGLEECRPHRCTYPQCDRAYTVKESLKTHVKRVHEKEESSEEEYEDSGDEDDERADQIGALLLS